MAKFSVDREMQRARVSERRGALDEARNIYESILEAFPNNARARSALSALDGAGQKREGADQAQARISALSSLYQQGQFALAAEQAAELAKELPSSFHLWNIFAAASYRLGRLEAAEFGFKKATALNPDFADAHDNLGAILMGQGRLEEAIASYRQVLRITPNDAAAHKTVGNALTNLGRREEATAHYERALRIKPNDAEAHSNLGNALMHQGRLDESLASYERALRISPGVGLALAQKMVLQALMCDWAADEALDGARHVLGIEGEAVLPFSMLAFEDSPQHQLQRAQLYAKQCFRLGSPPLAARPKQLGERLRVGYFSADFHDHATLYLIAGLLREHDRSRFEIFCFSYGPKRGGAMRAQVEQHVDHFIDIGDMADEVAVALARTYGLDIAVDLKGYTRDARSRLFAHRLAPVQINYLGFPGTMGADFIDYLISDQVIIPESERHFYTEKIVYLPNSYQPNDNRREIAETRTTRAELGLPDDAFVFCCFNNSYKISPCEFDIWMRLLSQVEGSVLWLLRSNLWAEANLRREAEQRGIDPGRLVFAENLPHAAHLARHKHADLFIDTFNVNAHTTVSDALWAGLPVVTKAGRQFAARVAASLLTAIGLPELVTETEEDYEALILDLATNSERLVALKAKLAENRLTQPLFDTIGYTRDFEQALEDIFAAHMRGMAHTA